MERSGFDFQELLPRTYMTSITTVNNIPTEVTFINKKNHLIDLYDRGLKFKGPHINELVSIVTTQCMSGYVVADIDTYYLQLYALPRRAITRSLKHILLLYCSPIDALTHLTENNQDCEKDK